MGALNAQGARVGQAAVSLYWKGRVDLDLHVKTPSGNEIYYPSQNQCVREGGRTVLSEGVLDTDMQGDERWVDDFVENILFHEMEHNIPEEAQWYTAWVECVEFDKLEDLRDANNNHTE